MKTADHLRDEEDFVDLLREWRAITPPVSVDLSTWERQLSALRAEELRLRSEGNWARGRDDFMGILGIERAEIRHSRMIAWLLDPCGRHGLGVSFLEAVLRQTMTSEEIDTIRSGLAAAASSCEVVIEGGRLDIVVEAAGLYLVIENKVDAPEADRQCEYYFDTVLRSGRRFMFLTPDARPLRTEREDVREAFALCLYSQIADMLEGALRAGNPEATARFVAVDYLRTLRKEFR